MTGVAEDADELGNGETERISNIMDAIECGEEDRSGWSMKRFCHRDNRRKRPILSTMNDHNQRDRIRRKGKNLKNVQHPTSTVYIKKDVHSALRKETTRWRKMEREEKESFFSSSFSSLLFLLIPAPPSPSIFILFEIDAALPIIAH